MVVKTKERESQYVLTARFFIGLNKTKDIKTQCGHKVKQKNR